RVRRLALLTAWLLIVGAVGIAWQASEVDEQALARMASSAEAEVIGDWVPFSPDALQAAQDEGRAVYVDCTAAWCAVCQANKLIGFEGRGSERVWQRIDDLNVVMMRADWTRKDALIYHYLQS